LYLNNNLKYWVKILYEEALLKQASPAARLSLRSSPVEIGVNQMNHSVSAKTWFMTAMNGLNRQFAQAPHGVDVVWYVRPR